MFLVVILGEFKEVGSLSSSVSLLSHIVQLSDFFKNCNSTSSSTVAAVTDLLLQLTSSAISPEMLFFNVLKAFC